MSLKALFIFQVYIFLLPAAFANTIINKNPLSATSELSQQKLNPGENTELILHLKLAPHHKAYKDQFKLKTGDNKVFRVGDYTLNPIISFHDKYSKKVRQGIQSEAQLKTVIEVDTQLSSGTINTHILLTYQACTETYCLLPQDLKIPLKIEIINDSSPTVTLKPQPSASKNNFFQVAQNKGLVFVFLLVFVAGILTSFTPCVFPMIPITLAIIGNRAHTRTQWQNFLASTSYVFGISMTYSALGLFAASTGSLFGAYMGHPIIVIAISTVFLLMALSMFGLFDLQLPQFLLQPLTKINSGSGYFGAFVAGLVAGLVASPCVGPVLVGVLTFVAKSQNLVLGFFLLMTFAFGMGLIFILLGTSSTLLSKLPQSGPWMNRIKYFFGLLMLIASFYFAAPVLQKYFLKPTKVTQASADQLHFVPYSKDRLEAAIKAKKPVIIDFWAEWCVACKDFEKTTFRSQKLKALTKDFVLLKFDATENSPELGELQSKYEIFGLPHLVFYDQNGSYRKELTLTGYENEDEFYKRIKNLLNK